MRWEAARCVYANTLYRPLDAFYTDPAWADITDWRAELAPFYDQAERMLGVVETPIDTRADAIMRDLAEELGVADTFHPTPVGVWFGAPGETGVRPVLRRRGPGPHRLHPLRLLHDGLSTRGQEHPRHQLPAPGGEAGGRGPPGARGDRRPPRSPVAATRSTTQRPGAWVRKRRRTFGPSRSSSPRPPSGTQKLLHKLAGNGSLPDLSERLGHLSRTNSEAIVTAESDDHGLDFTDGIAITSSIHPDAQTHIEPVRYGKGSNAMGLLTTVMVDGGGRIPGRCASSSRCSCTRSPS